MGATAIKIVGMKAGGREHIVKDCRINHPALLVPEPANRYDPHAIAVYTAPTEMLASPEVMVSSVTANDHVGFLTSEDRALLMSRQVGYVPKDMAAKLKLPKTGLVGYVSNVRVAPTEYLRDGSLAPETVAGIDVTVWLGDVWVRSQTLSPSVAAAIRRTNELDPDFTACDRVGHRYISDLAGGTMKCRRCQHTKPPDPPTGTSYVLWPISQLRELATERGLDPSGSKQDLDRRLNDFDKAKK